MKAPPDSPRLHASATLKPSPRNINSVFDLQICSESFLASDLSRVCDSRASDGDDLPLQTASPYVSKDIHAETLAFSRSNQITGIRPHAEDSEDDDKDDDNDDDDDDLQWANRRPPFPQAFQRSGYGDCKLPYKASNTPGKENMVRFPCKPASFPIVIARQQHSGLIRPHSGPFSGPLTPIVAKHNRVPSIIPVNLHRCRKPSFNAREPMSPKVTCLGRIRNKELYSKCNELHSKCSADTADVDELSVDSQTSQKGRCFDTKNQLCGKRGKGRKKKDKARGLSNSRRKRFSSTGSKSFPSPVSSELGQTRRERAAVLARSLSSLIEDVRQAEKESSHYVPSVPPPNSLLLMRGCRKGSEDIDTDASGSDEHHVEENANIRAQGELSVPPPNSLLLMRGCRVRGSLPLSAELKAARALVKNKHAEAYVNSITRVRSAGDDVYHVKKMKARAAKHLSLLDLIDVEENAIDEGASTSEGHVQGSHVCASESETLERLEAVVEVVNKVRGGGGFTQKTHSRPTLCQRRSFGELSAIKVGQHTKFER